MTPAWRTAVAVAALVAAVAAPARAQSAPAVSVRGFVSAAEESFAAKTTFDAAFGSARGSFLGGGGQVIFGPIFVEVAASKFKESGQRAFLFGGQTYQLGIPLTATLRPLELSAGYRLRLSGISWLVPYGGAGVGWYHYTESSDFSDPTEHVDATRTGYLVVGGVEVRLQRWVGVSVDAAYTHIPGILGQSGLSKDAGENDLGGTAVRLRVLVGR